MFWRWLAISKLLQFTFRRYEEDFAALGSELEKLALAYPESFASRDKIACAQFVNALTDNNLRRTLQMEGVTSFNVAVERREL